MGGIYREWGFLVYLLSSDLFMAVLGLPCGCTGSFLCCCSGLSLAASGGYSLAVVRGFLIAAASLFWSTGSRGMQAQELWCVGCCPTACGI